jgi:transposase
MIDWLSARGIPFSDRMCKPELYYLIKLRKPRFKPFKIGALLAEHGHTVFRFPPYHPNLNPIELIWASVKEYVARKNVSFRPSG